MHTLIYLSVIVFCNIQPIALFKKSFSNWVQRGNLFLIFCLARHRNLLGMMQKFCSICSIVTNEWNNLKKCLPPSMHREKKCLNSAPPNMHRTSHHHATPNHTTIRKLTTPYHITSNIISYHAISNHNISYFNISSRHHMTQLPCTTSYHTRQQPYTTSYHTTQPPCTTSQHFISSYHFTTQHRTSSTTIHHITYVLEKMENSDNFGD